MDSDRIERFVFEGAGVRGTLVCLGAAVSEAWKHQRPPLPVRVVLGEALAASALLAATIKNEDGSLHLQVEGAKKGTLSFSRPSNSPRQKNESVPFLLVARCTGSREIRGMARWDDGIDDRSGGVFPKTGTLALTLDPGPGAERFQGIVSLTGGNLAAALEEYFARSEQIDTRLWLACDGERAGGLLLQKLPDREPEDPDLWNRLQILAETVSADELLDAAGRRLLPKLFPEDDIRLFPEEPVRFRCGCDRERVAAILRAMGRAEADDIVEQEGAVEAKCEYCGAAHRFDAIDVAALFQEAPPAEAPPTKQ